MRPPRSSSRQDRKACRRASSSRTAILLANCAQSLTRGRLQRRPTRCSTRCQCSIQFGLTAGLLMPLRRRRAESISIRRRCTTASSRSWSTSSNATILFGTDTFLAGYARVAAPLRFRARASRVRRRRSRQGPDAPDSIWTASACVFSKATASPKLLPVLAINTPLAIRAGTVGRFSPLMEAASNRYRASTEGGRLYRARTKRHARLSIAPKIRAFSNRRSTAGTIPATSSRSIPQGFITIKGRAKRFAKIGRRDGFAFAVEALAAELWPQHITVVVALPDASARASGWCC